MGFHVTLREDDQRLLDFLKSSPADVFGRPYAAYLLFLVGGADSVALEWLRKHLVPLDSLTGDFVAFALFAEKVPVRLCVADDRDERQARFLGDVPFTDIQRIDSYVRSGNLGRVADGDHLNAITYATDRVARAFGVLDRLPCLLVLDAFPGDHVDVIELRESEMKELLAMLRSAVHRLNEEPRFPEFAAALRDLAAVQCGLDRINANIRRKKLELSEVPGGHDVDVNVEQLYREIRERLLAGSHRGFNACIEQLRNYGESTSLRIEPEFDEKVSKQVVRSAKTIAALAELERSHWPLSEPDLARYAETVSTYVTRLLPESPIDPILGTRDELLELKDRLNQLQSQLIAGVMGSFAPESVVAVAMKKAYSDKRESVQAEIRELAAELESTREKGRLAITWCIGHEAPSLSKILRELARERKVRIIGRTVVDRLAAYAGKAVDPETILKALSTAMGAG